MKKFSKDGLLAYMRKEARGFTKLLVCSYAISLLAGLYYLFDLLSHFTLQYILGGLILGTALILTRDFRWALLAFSVCALSLAESRWNLHEPFRLSPDRRPAVYKIVSFNHLFARQGFDDVKAWLADPHNEFDVAVLIEATPRTVEMARTLSEIYPYQIHEPQNDAFGKVILSRHPFLESEKILLPGPFYTGFAVRLKIHSPKAQHPLTIYALHPFPPVGPRAQAQRNFELFTIADLVRRDTSVNKIMAGDWNITPFAPAFRQVIENSGLHYQAYGFMQNPTWPTFTFLPFLKIPIDHVLYSDNLIQVQKEVGPPLWAITIP